MIRVSAVPLPPAYPVLGLRVTDNDVWIIRGPAVPKLYLDAVWFDAVEVQNAVGKAPPEVGANLGQLH